MKITLILVGKTNDRLYAEGIDDYAKRINHYMPFNIKVIPDIKNSKSLNEEQQKTKEGERIFVIGGPYGFSKAVYDRADDKLSLSRLTFSHQMVRLILAEQVYRACTIMKNEPYHHE